MALGAVSPVAGEFNFIIIEYSKSSVNGEVAGQFFAGMDTMNHEAEVNGLWNYVEEGTAKSGWNVLRDVHVRRIMA